MKLKVRYDIWIHLVVIFEGLWVFSCIFVFFYHAIRVFNGTAWHTHIRFRESTFQPLQDLPVLKRVTVGLKVFGKHRLGELMGV